LFHIVVSLSDSNFITRMLYKDKYLASKTLQLSICVLLVVYRWLAFCHAAIERRLID